MQYPLWSNTEETCNSGFSYRSLHEKTIDKKKSQQLGQVNYAGVWERNQPTGAESMKSNINFD